MNKPATCTFDLLKSMRSTRIDERRFRICEMVFDSLSRQVRLILREILVTSFNSLSYILKKDKSIICFLSLHEHDAYVGNLKALFEEMIVSDLGLNPIWLARTRETYRNLSGKGLPVVYRPSFPYLDLLRANMIAIDTSGSRFCGKFKLIQVWHGTGFKNIGFLQKGRSRPPSFWPEESRNYVIFIATSEQDKIRKERSFPLSNVVITGSPRNDVLFRGGGMTALKNKLDIEANKMVFLYAPTFRDIGDFTLFSLEEMIQISNCLSKVGGVLLVKSHPHSRKIKIPSAVDCIYDVTEESELDVQEMLLAADVLISDYSGIVTDFAITGRPIIFYWPDYDQYKKQCRDFYYDIERILPGPFVYNVSGLVKAMIGRDWWLDETYKERYADFIERFHFYRDDCSAHRVCREVKRLID